MGRTTNGSQRDSSAMHDAATARAALAAASSEPDLDVALRLAAQALRARFLADHASIVVQPGHGQARAVADDTLGLDERWLRKWLIHPDRPDRVSIAADAHPVIHDLAVLERSPSQEESYLLGARSAMRLPLLDESGGVLGLVVVLSREPHAYNGAAISEFREFAGILSGFVSRAIVVERMHAERALLAHEAEILGRIAIAGSEDEVARVVVDGVREALGADVAAVLTLPPRPTRIVAVAPAGALTEAAGAAIREAIQEPGNAPLRRVAIGCYVNHDLADVAPTPVERCIRDTLEQRSLLMAAGPSSEDGGIAIAVAAAIAGAWDASATAFLSRVVRALEHSAQHHRSNGLAIRQAERVAAQARLLAALGAGATMEAVSGVLVEEAGCLFDATHAVVVEFTAGGPRLVARSSDFIEAEVALAAFNPDGQCGSLADGDGDPCLVADLGRASRGAIEEQAFQAGLGSLMRVPIRKAPGEVTGLVVVGRPEPGAWANDDLDRLAELGAALGLVVERSELLLAAEERTAMVGHLTRLLSSLQASAPPEEIARLFAAEVRRFLSADTVVINAFEHDAGVRHRVAVDSSVPVVAGPQRKPLGESGGFQGMVAHPTALYDGRHPDGASAWLRETAVLMGMESVIAVRLDAEGVPVGMIAAGATVAGTLGAGELQVLTEVAAPLAMVLERARVVTSLRQQTQRTQAVLDILAALGPQETIEEVATPVANAIRAMFSADHCTIVLVDGADTVLAGIDSEFVPEWGPGRRIPRTEIFDFVAAEGFQVVADLGEASGSSVAARELRDRGDRSVIRARIGAAGQPLGMVSVGSRITGRYSETDARQLAQIVQPLAVAISYFHERRELEQRSTRLEYTNRILTRLSAGGAPEHLAAGFLEECRSLFNCGHAQAVYFDEDSGRARLLGINSDVIDPSLLPESLGIHELTSGQLIDRPLPQLTVDAREDTAPSKYRQQLIAAGLYSAIRAPLIVHEHVRGAVALWGHGNRPYTREDAELLGTLTRPLAIALEKAAALASLGESELKYRSLVAQAEEMIFLFDTSTRAILDANAYTARALGYAQHEILRLRLDDIVEATPDDLAAQVQRTVDDGELHLADRRYRRRDGSLLDADDVASLVAYGGRQAVLVLARDVSERKTLQRQLAQSQKMESLGGMAGNVAHDFNNLLTTILGFTGLLKRSRNLDSEERENLGLIEDAARRAADLTGRLLSFARGGLVRFGPVDLRSVISDTMRLAEPGLHQGIQTATTLPGAPVTVEGDAGQLEQSLLNIILNARDAMPDGGTIDVELRTDGAVATITIADNGPGMDEETRTRIFEPFFTTKPVGSGTGLGMAITYGIVQGHHGDVAVDSRKGVGTTFTITLPLLPGDSHSLGIDFNAGEGNLVLLVDDDEMVRRATSATLAELGYNVVEAPGGATAVEVVRARPDRFSVVLLDLVMPGMTGSETFRALTAIRADLPVVVCTGYAADAHIDMDVKRRIAGLVQKPFTAERLARALEAAGAKPSRKPFS